VIRIDAVWLAVNPIDMRTGVDRLLASVVQVFGAAQAHHGYLFANARSSRIRLLVHDGFGVGRGTTTEQGWLRLAPRCRRRRCSAGADQRSIRRAGPGPHGRRSAIRVRVKAPINPPPSSTISAQREIWGSSIVRERWVRVRFPFEPPRCLPGRPMRPQF
jgi:hypothetical protein